MTNKFKAAAVQAAPIFMDLNRTVDKTIDYIKVAAENGAELIAFPECWIPGYPWWVWLDAPARNIKYFQQYHENCLIPGSDAFERIRTAAKEFGIFVSLGASERDHGSLYISQFLFSDEGELLKSRRKLKPTHMERTVFGEGDGSGLSVEETRLGRIGQLNCWEHMQPLVKHAMFSMHEQIHIGAWPSFSSNPDAYVLGPVLCNALSQVYAAEGQCFVLAPCAIVSPEMLELMVETEEQAQLLKGGGGFAQIFGPDGKPLCDPLPEDEEGLLFAELDLKAITISKCFADPVGHYSRPDVTRLLLNRSPQPKVEEFLPELFDMAGETECKNEA